MTVTDNDTDTISTQTSIGQLISFQDDGPGAVNDGSIANPIVQPTQNQAFTIDALANDAFGADGVVTTDGTKVFVSTQAMQGVVTYNPANGLFTYTPGTEAGSDSTSDSFQYTIIDRDGDISVATVTIRLQPDSTPSAAAEAAAVDDDGLPGGNPASTVNDLQSNAGGEDTNASEAFYSGTLNADFGADAPGKFSFASTLTGTTAMVGTELVTFAVTGVVMGQGTVLTATGPRGELFTVTITNQTTGAYTVELKDNVLHDPRTGQTDDNTENLPEFDGSVSIPFTVTDSGGTDTTTANLTITFDDDAPTVNAASNVTLTGMQLTGTGDFVYAIGADSRDVPTTANGDFTQVTLSGSVGPNSIVLPPNYTLTKVSESAATAVFTFAFQYDPDPTNPNNPLVANGGTLTFYKTDPDGLGPLTAGQYQVTLNSAIQSSTISQTGQQVGKVSYDLTGSPAPEIVVVELTDGSFIRFTGDRDSGTNINAGGDGTFTNGELFSADQSNISVSGASNGIGSDTIQRQEVLSLEFYDANPEVGPAAIDPVNGLTLRVDGLGKEDFVVVLQLLDTVTMTTTTRAIIIDSTDIYRPGDTIPAGYAAPIGFAGNDGFVIIEANDYQLGNTNLVITGAQFLSSTTISPGVSFEGSGIDLNRDTGVAGGSTVIEAFGTADVQGVSSATSDQDVIKIVDIGLVRTVTTTQDISLNFNVTITDTDGDSVSQLLQLNPPPPAMAQSRMIVSEEPADSLSSMSLASISSEDQQLQKTAANNNTVVLAAALAAAGMAATPAAAETDALSAIGTDSEIASGGEQSARVAANDDGAAADTGRSLLGNESRVSADDGKGSNDTAGGAVDAGKAKLVSDDSVPVAAPTDLLSATDSPANDAAANLIAPMFVMPTAEALESLAGQAGDGVQRSGTVEKVVAEALEGGAEGDLIAAILSHLLGGRDGHDAALDALATPGGDAVPGRDMGQVGYFQTEALMNIGTDVSAFHHDAVQPAING